MIARHLLTISLLLIGTLCGTVALAEPRKFAVVVGANQAPPGRAQLRYAHQDAQRVAEVLTTVGGFKSSDVKVLFDPKPTDLLAVLDRALVTAQAGEALLFFYYSGHADERFIFPGGERLAFADVKTRLDDRRAGLRVGLLDACRGGGWTGSKGLKTVEPFEMAPEPQLAEEGSVLIASSAGQENAHEAEALQGSFFTHHWNAALRGAADRTGDGVVTLGEAFEYARALTIRDTAAVGQVPQHPSFRMQLAGRQDLPLAWLGKQHTTLLFEQQTGPTELVRLSDGVVVVETRAGASQIRLGLAPGNYLVRRRTSRGALVRIVTLSAGGTTTLSESELERSSLSSGTAKGVDELDAVAPTWAGKSVYASLALGVRHAPVIDPGLRAGASDGKGVVLLRASLRATEHVWWTAPLSVVYDAERASAFNWLAWAGSPVLSAARKPEVERLSFGGIVGVGIDARVRQNGRHTYNASLSELSAFGFGDPWQETLTTQLTLGISETIPETVTFNLGVAAASHLVIDGGFSGGGLGSADRASTLAFGSVQRAGLRPLPLIHIPVSKAWGLDAHAAVAYLPATRSWVETYLAGVSYTE
jgi:hypothetical protein